MAVTGCSSQSSSKALQNTESVKSVESTVESKSTETPIAAEPELRVITDHFGNKVELPNKIERVVIVQLLPLPSVYAVYKGASIEGLVGMPPNSMNAAENSILKKYVPEIVEVSTEFYQSGVVNIEELLKLRPDVVLYSGAKNTDIFKEAGITAVGFIPAFKGPNTIEDVGSWITLLEEIFQEESKTTGIVEYGRELEQLVSERISKIPEDERKKVLMISQYTDAALAPAGAETFGEYWSEATGSINVALGAQGSSVNMEQVYEWEPDQIYISTLTDVMPDDLYNGTAPTGHDWSTIPAVLNKEVYKFPLGIHRWYPTSSDAPLSLLWLAKHTYPELFEDINMEQTIKDYYKKFYEMDITDEDVNWILNPVDGLGFK